MKKKSYNTKDWKATIAARTGFKKSYITNIKLVEERPIPDHVQGWTEQDFEFLYKGFKYRVVEHIVPNADGEVKYSAEYEYTIVIVL